MKHIKLFEDITSHGLILLPSQEKITDDIKDMFVNLTDNNFDINLYFEEIPQNNKYYFVNIDFTKSKGFFKIDEVKDNILMAIDYIKIEWGDVSVKYFVNYVKSDKLPIYGSETARFIKINDIPKYYLIYRITVTIEKIDAKKGFLKRFFKRK